MEPGWWTRAAVRFTLAQVAGMADTSQPLLSAAPWLWGAGGTQG